MSKYFKEVPFEIPADPGEPKKPPTGITFNPDKLKKVCETIRQEFQKIRTGTSNLTTYAIDPKDFSFPAGNRLTMFLDEPTEKNMVAFIEIAKQDLGYRAAVAFAQWISEAKETNDECN